MTNPFKDRILRTTYDAMVEEYRRRGKDLFWPGGRRNRGNAWATNFWRGYDNVTQPEWDRRSKMTPAYACWRAGRDCAACDATNNDETGR